MNELEAFLKQMDIEHTDRLDVRKPNVNMTVADFLSSVDEDVRGGLLRHVHIVLTIRFVLSRVPNEPVTKANVLEVISGMCHAKGGL